MKAREVISDCQHHGWIVFCPACECGHIFDARWAFNGDQEKPTFTPSMLVHGWPDDPNRLPGYRVQRRCHSYVTNGRIQFLADCEHAMVGQTVDLKDVLCDNP